MAAKASTSISLKEYLKKYESNDEVIKKKKKKKKKPSAEGKGVLVVDEDPVWQRPVEAEEDGDDAADEEKPQIDEDIEVKHMKRLAMLKSRHPYHRISEDGSGWVSISDQMSDISEPCRNMARYDTPSPKPEADHSELDKEGTDLSPPRRHRARYDTSPKPKPLGSDEEATDLSPPRKSRVRCATPSPEPKRSASRSTRTDTDMSPPRRQPRFQDLAENLRKNPHTPDLDLSPPRKNKKDIGRHGPDNSSELSDDHLGPKEILSKERPKTGLVTGQDIKEQIARTKKNDWLRFKGMDPSISGRGAEPIYRDKTKGVRVTKEEFFQSKKGEEKPKDKEIEWGKGLAQKRDAELKQQELEQEKVKPFARSRDDPDLDNMLKERVRWGDPMAHLVKKKRSEPALPVLGDSEKMKESGFIIPQEIPSHSWIKRGIDAAPNRYGIRPGRHWDGVDRSNGFEKELFKRMNEKRATEREAYLWSVADM